MEARRTGLCSRTRQISATHRFRLEAGKLKHALLRQAGRYSSSCEIVSSLISFVFVACRAVLGFSQLETRTLRRLTDSLSMMAHDRLQNASTGWTLTAELFSYGNWQEVIVTRNSATMPMVTSASKFKARMGSLKCITCLCQGPRDQGWG